MRRATLREDLRSGRATRCASRRFSSIDADCRSQVMYGKLSYKGNGCNCYILCENESQALEKVGLMRFMKVCDLNPAHRQNEDSCSVGKQHLHTTEERDLHLCDKTGDWFSVVMLLSCILSWLQQSIADFEKQYAVQTKVVEKKEDVHSAESGLLKHACEKNVISFLTFRKNVPPDAEPSEGNLKLMIKSLCEINSVLAGSANLVEKKQVVLSANWPEDGVYICKEDDKCCDIAKLFGVDLDLLVEKNKKTYK
eukprot:750111-Hanusia_phi.AAC.4